MRLYEHIKGMICYAEYIGDSRAGRLREKFETIQDPLLNLL